VRGDLEPAGLVLAHLVVITAVGVQVLDAEVRRFGGHAQDDLGQPMKLNRT
jgi:hypothetical protein